MKQEFFFTADMLHDWRQQDLPALTDRDFVIMIVGSLIAAGKRLAVAPSFRLRTKTRDASSTLPGRNKHPRGRSPVMRTRGQEVQTIPVSLRFQTNSKSLRQLKRFALATET